MYDPIQSNYNIIENSRNAFSEEEVNYVFDYVYEQYLESLKPKLVVCDDGKQKESIKYLKISF